MWQEHILCIKYKIVNGKHKGDNADICDSASCCQAWISKEDRLAKWNEKEIDNRIAFELRDKEEKIIAPKYILIETNNYKSTKTT